MKPEIAELRRQEDMFARQAEIARLKLAAVVRDCPHKWGKTEYVPEYHEGYRTEGDPVGTCGVDWRGPIDVPSKTIPKWRRVCEYCGEVDETTNTKQQVTNLPAW